jgi:hypothetical protein
MKISYSQADNNYLYPQSPFKRGKLTCPVCGRTHHYHCSVTEDGGLAICRNKRSDKQAKDGRFIHILTTRSDKPFYAVASTTVNENEVEKADADRLNAVYTTLLRHLKLTPSHADALLNERGLSDTTIAYNLYASVPDEAKGNRLARAMVKLGFDLSGVPGFYFQDGQWKLNTHYKGFYIPYRDERGRIVGLQIRRDGKPEQKYLWLTSVNRPGGVSSGSPLHFVKPDLALSAGEILITEGALKADRISEFANAPVLALAGVTAMSPDKLASLLREVIPNLETVIICFDMDWKEKIEVKAALFRLIDALKRLISNVTVRTWEAYLGKGYDDCLFSLSSNAK